HLDCLARAGERYPRRAIRKLAAAQISSRWFVAGKTATAQTASRGTRLPRQDHGRHEYCRAFHAAGWPHSDPPSWRARGHSGGNDANDLWRKPRHALARKEYQAADTGGAGARSGARRADGAAR